MSAKVGGNATENVPPEVKTFEQVKAVVDSFFQVLPGPMVGTVQKQKRSLSDQEIADFKKRIDLGQEFFEEIEGSRMVLDALGNFTADELKAMPYKNLQRIAKAFRVSAKQSTAALVTALAGKPKSIPVLQTRFWKTKEGKSILVQRLREARDAVDYPHPRQILAAERAATRGGQ